MTVMQMMIFLYLTVFVSFQIGQRIAMTNIKTSHFLLLILCIKIAWSNYG